MVNALVSKYFVPIKLKKLKRTLKKDIAQKQYYDFWSNLTSSQENMTKYIQQNLINIAEIDHNKLDWVSCEEAIR